MTLAAETTSWTGSFARALQGGGLRGIQERIRRLGILLRLMWYAHRRRKDTEGAARRALADLLIGARGASMKAGQWLGTLEDDSTLNSLTEPVEPRPLNEIWPVIEQRMGAGAAAKVDHLEAAFAAASLGQVHRIRLRFGQEMVVKVLYPGIAEAVAAELEWAGRMPALGAVKRFGFDLDTYKDLLKRHLDEELDTPQEALHQEAYRRQVCFPGLVVPEAFPDLSRPGLLFQVFEPSHPLAEARSWSPRRRRCLASTLLRSTLHGLFAKGLVHGDLHAGNLGCRYGRETPELVLYDFGCLLRLDERRRLALLRLIIGLREGDGLDVAACLVELGFDGRKLLHLSVDLTSLCRLLFEPFLLDRSYDLREWRLSERLGDLLGELRWWLRASGPPDSLLLLRAFLGLSRHLKTLDVHLRWWPMLTSSVGERVLEKARCFEPAPLSDELAALRRAPRPLARRLSLRVTELEAGQKLGDFEEKPEEVLRIDFPAQEVLHLAKIVPEKIQNQLLDSGVDLQALGNAAYRRGMPPGSIIHFVDRNRCYDLWLR